MKDRTMNELMAVHYAKSAQAYLSLWLDLHNETCVRYGSGPLTSGIGHATAAPEVIKMALRNLAQSEAQAGDMSLQCWRRAGRKIATWRKYCDSLGRKG